jgi:hypothetical protein
LGKKPVEHAPALRGCIGDAVNRFAFASWHDLGWDREHDGADHDVAKNSRNDDGQERSKWHGAPGVVRFFCHVRRGIKAGFGIDDV